MLCKGTHFLSFLTGYLQLLKGQSFKNMGEHCFLNELDIVGKPCIKGCILLLNGKTLRVLNVKKS